MLQALGGNGSSRTPSFVFEGLLLLTRWGGRAVSWAEPGFRSSAGDSRTLGDRHLGSPCRPFCGAAVRAVSCFLNYLQQAAVLGQNLRGALGFQTGWGPPPCSLGLGILQFTNVEHLGNLGAKKRSSWMDVAKILGPLWHQGRFREVLLLHTVLQALYEGPFAGIIFIHSVSSGGI